MPTGRFVFVVATLDDVTGWFRLYLDGVLASQINTPIRSLGPLDSTERPGLGFGGHANRSPGSYALHGAIDEIRIFSRALTPAEIALRYTEVSAP
jgi:hypothetical protein